MLWHEIKSFLLCCRPSDAERRKIKKCLKLFSLRFENDWLGGNKHSKQQNQTHGSEMFNERHIDVKGSQMRYKKEKSRGKGQGPGNLSTKFHLVLAAFILKLPSKGIWIALGSNKRLFEIYWDEMLGIAFSSSDSNRFFYISPKELLSCK